MGEKSLEPSSRSQLLVQAADASVSFRLADLRSPSLAPRDRDKVTSPATSQTVDAETPLSAFLSIDQRLMPGQAGADVDAHEDPAHAHAALLRYAQMRDYMREQMRMQIGVLSASLPSRLSEAMRGRLLLEMIPPTPTVQRSRPSPARPIRITAQIIR